MGILLSRARDGHCRWIVCEAVEHRRGEPVDIFGGRRVCGAPTIWPTSYCVEHCQRVYVHAPEVRHALDFSTRSAPPALDRQPELTEIFA